MTRSKTAARYPECSAIGMDNCERVTCCWDQWDDRTRVTAKQRADGRAFAEKFNAFLESRRPAPQRPLWSATDE